MKLPKKETSFTFSPPKGSVFRMDSVIDLTDTGKIACENSPNLQHLDTPRAPFAGIQTVAAHAECRLNS